MWDVVGGSSPRAGFTRGWHSAGRSLRDHPRSRGVYADLRLQPASISGSSPLARGLPVGNHRLVPSCRIIPARAGFTPGPSPENLHRWDHPRSRGVYSMGCMIRFLPAGSSPLARGLRPSVGMGHVRSRIIPARAGFTMSTRSDTRPKKDHPRSRGVYPRRGVQIHIDRGSSPLARGLLAGLVGGLGVPGIIPARAGFTAPGRAPWAAPADHPRSRGVYCPSGSTRSSLSGSSPLARGLPPEILWRPVENRIIPARAGFTN